MNNFLKSTFVAILIALGSTLSPVYSENTDMNIFSKKLEFAMNRNNDSKLKSFFKDDIFLNFIKKRESFLNNYSSLKWKIIPIINNKHKNKIVKVIINGERKIGDQIFDLFSEEFIKLDMSNNKINNFESLSSRAILKTKGSPLKIKLAIPEQVLTGSIYDVDIILENPLEKNFLVGGIVDTKNEIQTLKANPKIDIIPLGAGGLFKSVQAPMKAGKQSLAALLIHPEGVVSITKIIDVQ